MDVCHLLLDVRGQVPDEQLRALHAHWGGRQRRRRRNSAERSGVIQSGAPAACAAAGHEAARRCHCVELRSPVHACRPQASVATAKTRTSAAAAASAASAHDSDAHASANAGAMSDADRASSATLAPTCADGTTLSSPRYTDRRRAFPKTVDTIEGGDGSIRCVSTPVHDEGARLARVRLARHDVAVRARTISAENHVQLIDREVRRQVADEHLCHVGGACDFLRVGAVVTRAPDARARSAVGVLG
mmetsp:Transcript_76885/g.222216  ORF Transcript_76885/g.222216 Transcript_76885/m.222216 type:complete len:246 (-) Transcript_76885:15-752(-)